MNFKKFLNPTFGKILISMIFFILLFLIIGLPVINYIMCSPCLLGEDCFPCNLNLDFVNIRSFLQGVVIGKINLPILVGLIILELIISYIVSCLIIYEYKKLKKIKNKK